MAQSTLPIGNWRKSNHSWETNCVEVGTAADGTIGVRDSKDPDGAQLRFTRPEIQAFIQGAKDGEFDNL
jgi:hypothetical protein